MLQQRTCRQCGNQFKGGPRAFYCHSCRIERRREQCRDFRRRERKGDIRPLGSIDKCERCRKDYVVVSGLQRFCPVCQPVHAQEYDRETSLDFYHDNKDRINPVRYERRRKGPKKCAWCGKEFIANTCTNTCSPECRRHLKNKRWRDRYYRTHKKE